MVARQVVTKTETIVKVVSIEVGEGDVVCQLDPTPHTSKPVGPEIGAITRRLQSSGPVMVSEDEFVDAVMNGATWCGGLYEPCADGWGRFMGMQLFAIDVDNDAGNHTPLEPGQPGYLDPIAALQRCKDLNLEPMMLYFTLSSSVEPWWPKYRVVFKSDEPVCDESEARNLLESLMRLFPECDGSTKNLNRIWFGGTEFIDCRHGWWCK